MFKVGDKVTCYAYFSENYTDYSGEVGEIIALPKGNGDLYFEVKFDFENFLKHVPTHSDGIMLLLDKEMEHV